MRKIFTLCLALLLVVGYCLAARVSAAVTFTYKVVNGGARITGYTGTMPAELVIPEKLDGYPVTAIGIDAFNSATMTSVVLPDTVTTIEARAFQKSKLETINFPEGLTAINTRAFEKSALAAVDLPKTLLTIGDSAFRETKLTTLVLPNSITTIGTYVFKNTQLTSVVLPENMTVLPKGIFEYAPLTAIELPVHLTTISDNALSGTKLTELMIPPTVTSVGSWAFGNCNSLQYIRFLGDAPQMGSSAFANLNTIVYYPANNATWTEDVFQNYLGKTINWIAWGGSDKAAVCENSTQIAKYLTVSDALEACGENQYVLLLKDVEEDLTLTEDLYLDLAGHNFSGTVTTNGYRIYGMDMNTNDYTCEKGVGYFNALDPQGNPVVPEIHFSTPSGMLNWVRRYMSIPSEQGYSFHCFMLMMLSQSLEPATQSLGYRATFYGDDMVRSYLDPKEAWCYSINLEGMRPVVRGRSSDSFISTSDFTLRINHIDIANYGEHKIHAYTCLKLKDGTIIESDHYETSMRDVVEQINLEYSNFPQYKLDWVIEMIEKYPDVTKDWATSNLYIFHE